MVVTEELSVRFWAHVVKGMGDDSCWEWTGGKSTQMRYGALRIEGQTYYAHRVSWIIANGIIEPGTCVLHRCDNPPCVRPSHLFLGTKMENMQDKIAKGRQIRGSQVQQSVITDASAGEILVQYASGTTSALELARKYGINESTLRSIINGETWRHVDGPRLTRDEIIKIGKHNRATARCAAKAANGWRPGACRQCGVRGHYKTHCRKENTAT